jgi:hypothetical protein
MAAPLAAPLPSCERRAIFAKTMTAPPAPHAETMSSSTIARLRQLDAIFAIFGAFDRDKCLILQSRG